MLFSTQHWTTCVYFRNTFSRNLDQAVLPLCQVPPVSLKSISFLCKLMRLQAHSARDTLPFAQCFSDARGSSDKKSANFWIVGPSLPSSHDVIYDLVNKQTISPKTCTHVVVALELTPFWIEFGKKMYIYSNSEHVLIIIMWWKFILLFSINHFLFFCSKILSIYLNKIYNMAKTISAINKVASRYAHSQF